jgi:hypothetical protein
MFVAKKSLKKKSNEEICLVDSLQKSLAHVSARKDRVTAASGLASCLYIAPKVAAAFTGASSLS